MTIHSDLAAAVLAGGKSLRMGTDKAFLEYGGIPFVKVITDRLLKISDEVLVVIGGKSKTDFVNILDPRVRVQEDEVVLSNPVAGILSACLHVCKPYCAFVGCDNPFLKNEIITYLFEKARGDYSAAIPRGDRSVEPLCGVYNVRDTMMAAQSLIHGGNDISCKKLISLLSRVNYVDARELESVDPSLESLININSKRDIELLNGAEKPLRIEIPIQLRSH